MQSAPGNHDEPTDAHLHVDVHEKQNAHLHPKSSWKPKLQRKLSIRRKSAIPPFQWHLKRREINEAIYEHWEDKSFKSKERLEVDLGFGKYNPRLVPSLIPHGIEEDYDKNATLEISLDVPTKCPRSYKVASIRVIVSALDFRERKPLSSQREVVVPSLNIRTITVKEFISHDALKHSRSEYVEIRAEVCVIPSPDHESAM